MVMKGLYCRISAGFTLRNLRRRMAWCSCSVHAGLHLLGWRLGSVQQAGKHLRVMAPVAQKGRV